MIEGESDQIDHKPELTTVFDAAELLATSLDSAHDVELCLRILGLHGNVFLLPQVLSLAADLETRFTAMRHALPGLGAYLEQFLKAATLLKRLSIVQPELLEGVSAVQKAHYAGKQVADTFRYVSGWLRPLIKGFLSQCRDKDQLEFAKDVLTILWVAHAIGFLRPDDSNRSKGLMGIRDPRRLWSDSSAVFWAMPEVMRSAAAVDAEMSGGIRSITTLRWLRKLHSRLCVDQTCGYVFNGMFSYMFSFLARRNRMCPPLPILPGRAPPRPISLPLNERFLSCNNWNFPRPAELDKLRTLLREAPGYGPMNYEALIMYIALITGRTIDEALYVFVHHSPSSHQFQISITPVSAKWLIPLHGQSKCLELYLPDTLSIGLYNLVDRYRSGFLWEFLPSSLVQWRIRVEQFGEKELGCSSKRLNRILRDTLLRVVYAHSANRALVELLASHRVRRKASHENGQFPLAHYLDPFSPKTSEYFHLACKEVLGSFRKLKFTFHSTPRGTFGVSAVEHRLIAEKYRVAAKNPSLSGMPIDCHNEFSIYTLLLLIVSTGHRRSKTPFFFSWDFFLDQNLAFICDKAVVGSEARFVPLASVACHQVRNYLVHLRVLCESIRGSHPAIAKHIDSLIRIKEGNGKSVLDATKALESGFFFTIESDGRFRTLSTGDIDDHLVHDGYKVGTNEFRRCLADELWSQGHSGMEVAALLGHSNELHPFGPSSSWTVVEWANRLRPKIEQYLDARGWLACASPLVKQSHAQGPEVIPVCPRFREDNFGYESRLRERRLAATRARQVLRTVLPYELLSDSSVVFDDAMVADLRAQAMELLVHDAKARDQVLVIMTSIFKKARDKGTFIVAAAINLFRTEVSPVETTFGRHLALATEVRKIWIQRVGTPIGGILDAIERSAQLAISLVILDGILDPRKVETYVTGIFDGTGHNFYPDVVVLRGTIANDRFQYDCAHIPGSIVTGLLLGLRRKGSTISETKWRGWKVIDDRIKAILTRILGRPHESHGWNLDSLCLVFRSYWFVRLPGPIFAIATGTFNGPAAEAVSEASLLGREALPPAELDSKPQRLIAEIDATEQQKRAIHFLNELARKAAGKVEAGTANARSQRQRLTSLLNRESENELNYYAREQPIVDAVLSFIEFLVHSDGKRVKMRRPVTILTYISRIKNSLITEGWNQDIEDWSAQEFVDYYERVLKLVQDLKSKAKAAEILIWFHDHLRDTHGAPYLPSRSWGGRQRQQRCRSIVYTAADVNRGFDLISNGKTVAAPIRDSTSSLLYVAYGYGLRSREGLGLHVGSFDSVTTDFLTIERNVIRDLKVKKYGRRAIPNTIAGRTGRRSFLTRRKQAALSPYERPFLLETAAPNALIQPVNPIRRNLISVLRTASGNPAAVIQDIRHTYATRLMLAALPPPITLPCVATGRVRLGPITDDNEEAFVRTLTNTPSGNPFVIDGIARLLGHGSVDTMLNVYFNCGYFVHAEYVRSVSADCSITDGQLAGLLDIDRSAVQKQRTRMIKKAASVEDTPVRWTEAVVQHCLKRLTDIEEQKDRRVAVRDEGRAANEERKWFRWVLIDRLLCLRKTQSMTLDELLELAVTDYNVDEVAARCTVSYYRESVVRACGFDDFEPDRSELILRKPQRGPGVLKGRVERERLIEHAQELFDDSESFRTALKRVCQCWISWVNGDSPWFIARDVLDLSCFRDVFQRLGGYQPQMDVHYTGSQDTEMVVELQKWNPLAISDNRGRFSRGPKNVNSSEVAINLRQASGASMSDGRDTHRLFVVLSCCVAAISADGSSQSGVDSSRSDSQSSSV